MIRSKVLTSVKWLAVVVALSLIGDAVYRVCPSATPLYIFYALGGITVVMTCEFAPIMENQE